MSESDNEFADREKDSSTTLLDDVNDNLYSSNSDLQVLTNFNENLRVKFNFKNDFDTQLIIF
jgi:hypothetical protein